MQGLAKLRKAVGLMRERDEAQLQLSLIDNKLRKILGKLHVNGVNGATRKLRKTIAGPDAYVAMLKKLSSDDKARIAHIRKRRGVPHAIAMAQKMIEGTYRRTGSAAKVAETSATELRRPGLSKAGRRLPKVTPAFRAHLKLQGAYVSIAKRMPPFEKLKLRQLYKQKGVKAALAVAKRLDAKHKKAEAIEEKAKAKRLAIREKRIAEDHVQA
jgi:hypothetical protein